MLQVCQNNTLVSQLIISITLGILLSCMTSSLVVFAASALLIEGLLYYSVRGKGQMFSRLSLFFGYVFGWIIGRTVYSARTSVVSTEVDDELDL